MKLQIVVASTRPGRIGPVIGDWFTQQAKAHGGFDVEVTDLAELALPFLDEANHPMLGKYEHEHTKRWSATVAGSDAFALVVPEYNHSFTAPIKNALDFLNKEWAYKPVGFVSYGGVSGGMRAVAMLKQVVATLRMVPVVDAVTIPMVRTMLDEQGFHPTEIVEASVAPMLDELARLAGPLAAVREAR
ncbi:NAD(P)H-dependent oxidoreductase [Jatrophihabitans endophyticus]|uniref:NADPH-dependent FMN reductase n=1 Tax=Jatrophihabitans endophyticus TaxID=1206085 RepID=UPI001A00AFA3|nr:NAD(P)H-dependent oxidoreductase [Jatrophihabitans endophyticus]MBE7189659.1 NAD(P)H-dependent oxidoreductase [Jatrophihabitans endophyticus]